MNLGDGELAEEREVETQRKKGSGYSKKPDPQEQQRRNFQGQVVGRLARTRCAWLSIVVHTALRRPRPEEP